MAISSALMIGIGFPPLYAAGLALIANTAPVAFGSLGTPIITLAGVTGIHQDLISVMAGRQLPIFSLLIPAWMIVVMSGWRGLREVWPAALMAGGSFAVVQFGMSQLFGPMLVNVVGGLASLAVMAVFLRFWKPRTIWRFADEPAAVPDPVAEFESHSTHDSAPAAKPTTRRYTTGEMAHAWVPWILLSLAVFLWGLPSFRTFLEGGLTQKQIDAAAAKAVAEGKEPQPPAWFEQPNAMAGITVVRIPIETLNNHVHRGPPVAQPDAPAEQAVYTFNWLTATGTSVLIARCWQPFGSAFRRGAL